MAKNQRIAFELPDLGSTALQMKPGIPHGISPSPSRISTAEYCTEARIRPTHAMADSGRAGSAPIQHRYRGCSPLEHRWIAHRFPWRQSWIYAPQGLKPGADGSPKAVAIVFSAGARWSFSPRVTICLNSCLNLSGIADWPVSKLLGVEERQDGVHIAVRVAAGLCNGFKDCQPSPARPGHSQLLQQPDSAVRVHFGFVGSQYPDVPRVATRPIDK